MRQHLAHWEKLVAGLGIICVWTKEKIQCHENNERKELKSWQCFRQPLISTLKDLWFEAGRWGLVCRICPSNFIAIKSIRTTEKIRLFSRGMQLYDVYFLLHYNYLIHCVSTTNESALYLTYLSPVEKQVGDSCKTKLKALPVWQTVHKIKLMLFTTLLLSRHFRKNDIKMTKTIKVITCSNHQLYEQILA